MVDLIFPELYSRLPDLARSAVQGLDADALVARPAPGANTIGWLVWHAARVQDHHVAELRDADQVWVHGEWARGVGLEPDPSNTGYGHSAADVATVVPKGPGELLGYFDAVQAVTMALLAGLTTHDLERIVDRRWDPPVTMAVRLVSIADDDLQHLGQAAYVRGLLGR
jgi:hypothetical protein